MEENPQIRITGGYWKTSKSGEVQTYIVKMFKNYSSRCSVSNKLKLIKSNVKGIDAEAVLREEKLLT